MKNLPCMTPTGWFQVGWTADVPVGEVVPMHYFDKDLVCFRGHDNQVHILDAHCQHLGANLAAGCVVEDGIQCPFHGWVWNGEGRNVRIPYQDRPNRGRKVGSHFAAERNETIYLWHDTEGREPTWELPDAFSTLGPHVESPSYHPLSPECRTRFEKVATAPGIVAENAVDPHHFKFVHHLPISPKVLREDADSSTWSTKVGFGRRWDDGVDRAGDSLNTLEIFFSGLGVGFHGEHTAQGVRLVQLATTPVDQHLSDIFATYWIEDEGSDFAERLYSAQQSLPEDVAIWNDQIFIDPPGLATSEAAGFKKLRAWARGFYPEDQLAPRASAHSA